MNKRLYLYLNTCKNLIVSDLQVFKQTVLDKCIDITIWVILTIVVTAYIMPFFGLKHDFGPFQLGGVIAAIGLFELYGSVVDLVGDFEGDRVIKYNLTLPIPSWLAIISKSAYYFIIYTFLTVAMLPVGKICLWNQWDLAQVSYGKLVLAIIFQSGFYACFVLWASRITIPLLKISSTPKAYAVSPIPIIR